MSSRTDMKHFMRALCGIDGAYDLISKKVGLKSNLMWLLYVLDDGKFHSQKQICEDWLFPKTTINTLIKECEVAGYVTLRTIPGRKRELQVCLTEAGKNYAHHLLGFVYEAEEEALAETLRICPPAFITDFITFSENLIAAFEKRATPRKDSSR